MTTALDQDQIAAATASAQRAIESLAKANPAALTRLLEQLEAAEPALDTTALARGERETSPTASNPAHSTSRRGGRPSAKIDETKRAAIAKLLADGKLSQRQIAERLSVPRHAVIAVARNSGARRERKLRYHAASGQGFICVHGRREYLGPFHDKDTKRKYQQRLEELAEAQPEVAPATAVQAAAAEEVLLVKEMLLRYWAYAEKAYRSERGPMPQLENMREAVMRIEKHCGNILVSEFNVAHILEMRDAMIQERCARTYINSLMARVKRIFKWAIVREVVKQDDFEKAASKICNIEALSKGVAGVRESRKRKPAEDAWVEATLPFLPPPVRDMVRIQRLTGARAGEVMRLQSAEINRAIDPKGEVWLYKPAEHKTAHLSEERDIWFGKRSQAILRPYLLRYQTGYLFRPGDAVKWRERDEAICADFQSGVHDVKLLAQKHGLSVSNVYRIIQPLRTGKSTVHATSRRIRECYDRNSYGHAITRAIREANLARQEALELELGRPPSTAELKAVEIPHWSSHCLRHAYGTETRESSGLEVAQSGLGHQDQRTTERYARVRSSLASEDARKHG